MKKELKPPRFSKHLVLTVVLGIAVIAVISGILMSLTRPNQPQESVCPELLNAMQTEEPPIMPNPPAEPAPLPQTIGGYVYDNELDCGFNYPDNWGFSISVDKDLEQCDPTQHYEEYNCMDFSDSKIKKVITFTKDIFKDGSHISADIGFVVKPATDLQEVINEFKNVVEMSGLQILNEEAIYMNNLNGHDMLVGEDNGWKLRQVAFFANKTAYIFTYQSQDEPYRMYEETFNNVINSFNIKQ